MALTVGAPVHQRGWILHEWFDHLAHQEEFPPEEIDIVLNYGKSDDTTFGQIQYEIMRKRFRTVTVLTDPHDDHVGHRLWDMSRYQTMVRLRNTLLEHVREQKPDYYLSCDTDMLLPSHTLRTLFENFNGWDGIAPLTFMTTSGEHFPNCMSLDGRRSCPAETQQMGAIFGTVLMNEALYTQVDYSNNHQGEDLGWAANAERAGMKLAICTDVRVKHVMTEEMLGTLDVRIGF